MSERLLRGTIRAILSERQAAVKVGDLKKAMAIVKKAKSKEKAQEIGKEALKKGTEKGAGALIGLLPGGGTAWEAITGAKDVAELIWDAAKDSSPEEKKKNGLWNYITIDPETAAIVDDEVEDKFIKDYALEMQGRDDEQYIPGADDALEVYLTNKFDGRHVAGS
jgi:hypothetical protein